ncbi:MAG: BON domain-containing protein, partial [Acidimicrobiales bacterium]
TGYRTGRFLGYRRIALFGVGVAVGLLVAPTTGAEVRSKLRALLERRQSRLPDAELAERVRFELSHASKTWHLPQPDVSALSGRVILNGQVPHETARSDLERAAAGVPGVALVDNQLLVAGAGTNGAR